MNRTPVIRLSRPTDIANMRDLDIKCYDYPLTMEQWQELIKTSGNEGKARCIVVEHYGKPIGFAVWQEHEGEVLILRLGVLKEFRRQGVGTLLVNTILTDARRKHVDTINIVVPEIHCKVGDPDDVSEFLAKTGFRATGKIYENFKFMFGSWRDGYVFRRGVL